MPGDLGSGDGWYQAGNGAGLIAAIATPALSSGLWLSFWSVPFSQGQSGHGVVRHAVLSCARLPGPEGYGTQLLVSCCRCGIRRDGALFNLLNPWIEAARFSAHVQRVMALRMRRLASGGPTAATEAHQMVSEKFAAFGEAQGAVITALVAGKSLDAAVARAYGPYRRRVRANRRRLGP